VSDVSEQWNRLAEAFAYAAEIHRDQVRKQTGNEDRADGIPYISHLMAVAALVMEHGGDEDEAIAALLHDGPEDQGGEDTLEVIRERFGELVAQIVEECTDTFEDPKPEWWARKRAYHQNLRRASTPGLLISAADKVHNSESTLADLRAFGEGVWTRFQQGRTGSLWNYANLLVIYRERATGRTSRLVDRLERALDGLFVDEDEKAAARLWGPSPPASD
jgi:(p)ppGpp synthase/HD superfamily hydrolase